MGASGTGGHGRRPDSARRRGAALALIPVLGLLLAGCGLTAPRGNEGFADLDSLGVADTDRVMTISIGPALLRFAARHVDDDPETRELLRSLDGVRIRIYEIEQNPDRVAARMNDMSRKLADAGWERVMLVNHDQEQAHMLVKLDGDRICGMTVLVSDGDEEAVVINLMGDIRPQQFAGVMTALEVDAADVADIEPAEARDTDQQS